MRIYLVTGKDPQEMDKGYTPDDHKWYFATKKEAWAQYRYLKKHDCDYNEPYEYSIKPNSRSLATFLNAHNNS